MDISSLTGKQRLIVMISFCWLVLIGAICNSNYQFDWGPFLGIGVFPIVFISGFFWTIKGFNKDNASKPKTEQRNNFFEDAKNFLSEPQAPPEPIVATVSAPKKNSVWWPDMAAANGRKQGFANGAALCGLLAAGYMLTVGFLAFTGQPLFYKLENEEDWIYHLISNSMFILLGIVLGFFIYKKESKIASVILLFWVLFEVSMKFIAAPSKGIIMSLIYTLFAINCVRAAFSAPSTTYPETPKKEAV